MKKESGILLIQKGFYFYWITRDNVYEYYLYPDGDKMKKIRFRPSVESEIRKLLKE